MMLRFHMPTMHDKSLTRVDSAAAGSSRGPRLLNLGRRRSLKRLFYCRRRRRRGAIDQDAYDVKEQGPKEGGTLQSSVTLESAVDTIRVESGADSEWKEWTVDDSKVQEWLEEHRGILPQEAELFAKVAGSRIPSILSPFDGFWSDDEAGGKLSEEAQRKIQGALHELVHAVSPSKLEYSSQYSQGGPFHVIFTRGEAVNIAAPVTDGTHLTFHIKPDLPAGLQLDEKSGAISGVSDVITSRTEYTVAASNRKSEKLARIAFSVAEMYDAKRADEWTEDQVTLFLSRDMAVYMKDQYGFGNTNNPQPPALNARPCLPSESDHNRFLTWLEATVSRSKSTDSGFHVLQTSRRVREKSLSALLGNSYWS